MRRWTFLTNHALVMLHIARDPDCRLIDIANAVGMTERAAHRLVADLVDGGYVTRHRNGRRNSYTLHLSRPLEHPLVARDTQLGDLLKVLLEDETVLERKPSKVS